MARLPESPSPTVEEEAAFAVWAQAGTLRFGRPVLAALGLGTLLWLPTDPWFYAGQPAAIAEFGRARLLLGPLLLGAALTAPILQFAPRLIWPASFALSASGGAGLAWAMGGAGTPDGPWLTYLSAIQLLPVIVLAPLRARLPGMALMALCTVGAYLLRQPGALGHPVFGAAASYLLFMALLSVALGHLVYEALRRSFFDRSRYASLAQALDLRLAERTAALRALGRRAEASREAERQRIAADLHDELGQELAALQFAVAFGRSRPRPGPVFDELDALLRRTHETVRRLLTGLRPRALDELGLMPAVEVLCADIQARSGLVVRCQGEHSALSAEVSVAAYRIVQEALTNVVKHAQARQVEVRLRSTGEALMVEVADDGVGLSPEAGASEAGYGLLTIRERACSLGGDATWDGAPGTTLRVRLPLTVEVAR